MTMAHIIHEFGDADQLRWEAITLPDPQPNEVRIRQIAVGMNMMEIGLRIGAYPGPPLPFIPGVEAAAVVEAVGSEVKDIAVGDRVGYAGLPIGSYCEARNFPAERLFPLPDDISDKTAAASMVKGMTAEFMLRRSYPVGNGSRVLIHAAAGATGLMCVQLARHLGAEVFGTVSSDEKAAFVRDFGCEHPIVYTRDNFADQILDATDGAGVDVIYDSIGKDTFEDSVRCLQPMGTLCLFGVASGLPAPIDLMSQDLMTAKFFNRPSLYAHTAKRDHLLDIAAQTFSDVSAGVLRTEIFAEYPLRDAPQAHRAVESRKTQGAIVLNV
jgi:NADPH2:quinone reductase